MPKKLKIFKDKKPSTKTHRNAERTNVGINTVSTSIDIFNPGITIPAKFLQTLVSLASFLVTNTTRLEKAVHLMQALISITQLTFGIIILLDHRKCTLDSPEWVCEATLLTNYLYTGLLLTGWIPSEFNKDTTINKQALAQKISKVEENQEEIQKVHKQTIIDNAQKVEDEEAVPLKVSKSQFKFHKEPQYSAVNKSIELQRLPPRELRDRKSLSSPVDSPRNKANSEIEIKVIK